MNDGDDVTNADPLTIIAYRTMGTSMMLVPASPDRPWMDAFHTTFANRCLPMRIANQNGWFLLNPSPVSIVWNGGNKQSDLRIESLSDAPGGPMSHFGHGVVTWWIPFLFRTAPGYNLRVSGPVNFCKDGIIALEATVETDWAVASFPMSWKMTRVGEPVIFKRDEPICMISPLKRGQTERFRGVIRNIEDDPELHRAFTGWSDSRKAHNLKLKNPNAPRSWEKHYFLGKHPLAPTRFPDHQVKLDIGKFHDEAKPIESVFPGTTAPPGSVAQMACPWQSAKGLLAKRYKPGSDSTVDIEEEFFAEYDELEQVILRSIRASRDRNIGQLNWRYYDDHSSRLVFTADPRSAFPAPLSLALERRIEAWAAWNGIPSMIHTLQLTLLAPGGYRRPVAVGSHARYFVLPIMQPAQRADSMLFVRRLISETTGRSIVDALRRPYRELRMRGNVFLSPRPDCEVAIAHKDAWYRTSPALVLLEGTLASSTQDSCSQSSF